MHSWKTMNRSEYKYTYMYVASVLKFKFNNAIDCLIQYYMYVCNNHIQCNTKLSFKIGLIVLNLFYWS